MFRNRFAARAIAVGCAATIALSFVLLAASDTAMAGHGNTVRDHRDGKRAAKRAEGGITVNGRVTPVQAPSSVPGKGHKGGVSGWGGGGKNKGGESTLRDHR